MKIRIANPLSGGSEYTSAKQAREYCRSGAAFMAADGRLVFRTVSKARRTASDAYVDPRGTIWWNGARSHYVGTKDLATFPPGCNVVFPKTGSREAARRYA